jgi:hypothetical protein
MSSKKPKCLYCKCKRVVIKCEDGGYLCQLCFNAWRDGQENPDMGYVDVK